MKPALALAGLAALAVVLAVLVLAGELHALDALVNQRLAPLRAAPLVPLWQFFTDMGSNGGLTMVGVVASVLLWSSGRGADLRPLWLAGLGAMVTTWSVKYLLALPRPEEALLPLPVSPTFPSAHATGAIAVYGVLAWLAAHGRPAGARWVLGCGAAVLIAAIGGSRAVLGVHHASDVVAGYLVGGFWLLLAIALAKGRIGRASGRRGAA